VDTLPDNSTILHTFAGVDAHTHTTDQYKSVLTCKDKHQKFKRAHTQVSDDILM